MTIKIITDILSRFNATLFYYQNKTWHEVSPKNFIKAVDHIAGYLQKIGIKKGTMVGIMASSSPQWLMIDFAIQKRGAITVPLFYNMSSEHLAYILKQTKLQTLFVEDIDTAHLIRKKHKIKTIISFWEKSKDEICLKDIIENPSPPLPTTKINEKDTATIIYTSGSTGNPKGVMLSHANLVSQIKATKQLFPLKKDEVAFSFLPLAHVFERMVMYYYLSQGIKIYFNDHIDHIKNHLPVVKPTLMTTVPRFLEKIYKKSLEALETENIIKRFLGQTALKAASKGGCPFALKIFDILVYKKIRQKFGNRMRMIISGGAALPNDIERFFNTIGMPIYQGYGLTETSPVVSANYPGKNKLGTCGPAFPDSQVKVDKNKELLVKGPNVMQGYYKNAKDTKASFKDGWFKTGDLAEIDQDGYITLIGRKKESFKTSTGKYVIPTPIEHSVQKSRYIDQCLIIAEGKSFVSCLVFISEDHATVKNLKSHIQNHIKKVNKRLDHWEKVRKFSIIKNPLSIEKGDLTPSMKIRRHAVENTYKNEIKEMYNET